MAAGQSLHNPASDQGRGLCNRDIHGFNVIYVFPGIYGFIIISGDAKPD
jgi:hypothetical protein